MAERCVCCGAIIPEGRQVCPNCENAPLREKLVELVHDGEQQCTKISCKGCEHFFQLAKCKANIIADHLIANGVTLDNQVSSSKWIPVTERLPKLESYTYSVDVLFYSYEDGIHVGYVCFETGTWKDLYSRTLCAGDKVTHWMPLPEPPKD